MIGFYDYTVILTLMSLVSAVIGMTAAMQDRFRLAVVLLALCGFFDTFDGKVARTKKNRTDREKLYGIQLDSLVDVISFGIFPVLICYLMGMREFYDLLILSLYAICGVIRLAFFNVLETERQMNPNSGEKIFHGLPITSISFILPMAFLVCFVSTTLAFTVVLRVLMLITAILFVLDFKVRKPSNKQLFILLAVAGLAAVSVLLFARYKLPRDPEPEEPLIEIGYSVGDEQ